MLEVIFFLLVIILLIGFARYKKLIDSLDAINNKVLELTQKLDILFQKSEEKIVLKEEVADFGIYKEVSSGVEKQTIRLSEEKAITNINDIKILEKKPDNEASVEEVTDESPKAVNSENKLWKQISPLIKNIWNWILIGSEDKRKDVSYEYAIASTWLLRIGVIALLACVGYFLKWSIDHGLIGPWGRISVSIFVGLLMLVIGIRLLGKKYQVIGQGLLGGGFATLYFSVFAAGILYAKLSMPIAFLLMCLITLAAGLLSIRVNSMLVAIFGIIGGYVTPIILHAPNPNLVVFYSYLLVLSLGIFFIGHKKQWRLLNYLGFLFTYALFLMSLVNYDKSNFKITFLFITLYFLVYSSLVYLYNLQTKTKSTVLEVSQLILNAGVFTAVGYLLINDMFGRPYPALLTIGLAVYYIFHFYLFVTKKYKDKNLAISFLALTSFFVVFSVPLILEKESLTIVWSLQALLFIWLGIRLQSSFLKSISYFLYGVTMVRVGFFETAAEYSFNVQFSSFRDYIRRLVSHLWMFGVPIASFISAFILQNSSLKIKRGVGFDADNDTKVILKDEKSKSILFWISFFMLFMFLQFEFYNLFSFLPTFKMVSLTFLWCLFALFLLFYKKGEGYLSFVAMIFSWISIVKLLSYDIYSWGITSVGIYGGDYSIIYTVSRFIDFALVTALCFIVWRVLSNKPSKGEVHKVFGLLSVVFPLLFLSLELNTFLSIYFPVFQKGGVSILWAIYAIGMLVAGIRFNKSAIRFFALLLFSVIIAKVFLWDLAGMEIIVRVLAFLILGIILIIGSYSYIKSDKKFIH
jgi:hypothetical protein